MHKTLEEIIRIEILLTTGSQHTQDTFDVGHPGIGIIAIAQLAPDDGMTQGALTDIVGGIDIGIACKNEEGLVLRQNLLTGDAGSSMITIGSMSVPIKADAVRILHQSQGTIRI